MLTSNIVTVSSSCNNAGSHSAAKLCGSHNGDEGPIWWTEWDFTTKVSVCAVSNILFKSLVMCRLGRICPKFAPYIGLIFREHRFAMTLTVLLSSLPANCSTNHCLGMDICLPGVGAWCYVKNIVKYNERLMGWGKEKETSLSNYHHGQNCLDLGKINFLPIKSRWGNEK